MLDGRHVFDVAKSLGGVKGMGVYTTRFIKKGQWIGDYEGDLIDEKEYDRRYPKGEGEYVYWIREADLYLDAGPSTHFTRFINHSKRVPTLETKVEFVKVVNKEEVMSDLKPGVGFYALKDIPAGDELTFDYGGDYFDRDVTEDTM